MVGHLALFRFRCSGLHQLPSIAVQDCDNRLTASDFLTRISEIIDNGVAQSMDDNYKPVKYNAAQDCGCGTCCSVM